MKKVILSIIAILINVAFVQAIGPNVWGKNILQKIKYEISQESPRYIPAYKALRDFCDAEIERAPYSVMDKKLVPPSGNKHDYISIGRYWWPDPTKPDGLPYIRRDGQSNPERKQLDRERMGRHDGCSSKTRIDVLLQRRREICSKSRPFITGMVLERRYENEP